VSKRVVSERREHESANADPLLTARRILEKNEANKTEVERKRTRREAPRGEDEVLPLSLDLLVKAKPTPPV
jgi:hypothetical protein